MRKRRSAVELPPAAINITSLLDIMFVLLISFMIVAPTLRYEVGLKLPQVSSSTSQSKDKPVTLQVKHGDGGAEYFVNGNLVGLDGIVAAIESSKDYERDQAVSLEADRQAPWEDVAELMTLLKANNITQVSVVTEVRRN